MKFQEKRYLIAANVNMPEGWSLLEGRRIAASGAPTFTLILKQDSAFVGTEHTWLVEVDQPRKVLRAVVEAVEARGLVALTDTEFGTYTSRVRWSGYAFETVGLREALVDVDPSFAAVIDSEFHCARWAMPWSLPEGMTFEQILEDIELREKTFAPYEAQMGLKAGSYTETHLHFSVYKAEDIPASLPPEAIAL